MSEKACYIVGAGSFDGLLTYPEAGDLVIAADGGYTYLRKLGIDPDVLMGDFDSLEYVPEHEHLFRHSPIKDDTDMDLATAYAREHGYRRIYLYGGLGGRLDHTMGNFQLLTGLSRASVEAYLIGEGMIITAITAERIEFSRRAEGMISVFSMTNRSTGIRIRNLKYELSDAQMKCDKVLGVSNEFIGEKSSIEVQDGTLLIMWDLKNGMPTARAALADDENQKTETSKAELEEQI